MADGNIESSCIVRRIEPRDAHDVALLTGQLGYTRSAEAVLHWIAQLNSHRREQVAFVAFRRAETHSEIVGWIEVSIQHRLQTPPLALIGGLVVKQAFRGKGIGRLLCSHAEEWAWLQQVQTLRVTSRSSRQDAHRFYLRQGYRELKTSLVFEKKALQKS